MCTAHAQGVHNGAACYTRPAHNPCTWLPTATYDGSYPPVYTAPVTLHGIQQRPSDRLTTSLGAAAGGRPRLLGIPRDTLDRYGGAAPRALTLTALTCPKEAD